MKFAYSPSSKLTCLIVMSIIVTCMSISIPLESFQSYIGDKCFNSSYDRELLLNGQKTPVGSSIENLIALIEKAERKMPEVSAQEMVIMILRRFHLDGMKTRSGIHESSTDERRHRQITDQFLTSTSGIAKPFPEEVLTEDEKCNLFFTISHTINATARHDDPLHHVYEQPIQVARAPAPPSRGIATVGGPEKPNDTNKPIQSEFLQQKTPSKINMTKPININQTRNATNHSDHSHHVKDSEMHADQPRDNVLGNKNRPSVIIASDRNRLKVTIKPREIGVASLLNGKSQAIAINRVLLGIAAGLISPPTRSVRDVVKAINPTVNTDNIVDGQLDPLMAVTLSDLLGIDAGLGMAQPVGSRRFGAKGQWNSTACQTTYKLETNETDVTLAEVRGGLDGFNLGRKVKDLVLKNPKMQLSQILRMYYSQRGLTLETGYCSRAFGLDDLLNRLRSESENYIRIWNGVRHDGYYPDNKLTGFVAESWGQFSPVLQEAGRSYGLEDRDFCSLSTSADIKSSPCETPSDVIFLLDYNGTPNEQMQVIIEVLRTLDIRREGGTATILLNGRGDKGDPELVDEDNKFIQVPLKALVYNATSTQCATCRVAWFSNQTTFVQPVYDRHLLLELINQTLMQFEMKRESLAGVPSKSLVWFNYDSLKQIPTDRDSRRKYDDFKWRLRYEHRDVPIYFAALNKQPITDLLRHDDDFISVGTNLGDISQKAEKLAKKICETPATFQHNECRVKKSQDRLYQGFITPGFKQYWALYPEFFLKSYNIDLRFKAEDAKIKVCFDRYEKPEKEDRKCQEAKEEGGEVKFYIKNPCEGKTYENCQPFYFTIAINSQAAPRLNCQDIACKSLDQVKFFFTHSGMSCSSAGHLLPQGIFLLLSLVFVILYLSKNN